MKKTSLLMSLVFLLVVTGEALSFQLKDTTSKVQLKAQRETSRLTTSTKARSKGRNSPQTNPYTSLLGTWTNQLKSKLNITAVDANTGQITGTYKSPDGAGPNEFPLVGWVNTKAPQGKDNVIVLTFSVRWGSIGSVTTWAGYIRVDNNTPTLTAQWFLVRPNSEFKWDHILTNQDVFTKD